MKSSRTLIAAVTVILVLICAGSVGYAVHRIEPHQWQADQEAKNPAKDRAAEILSSERVAYYTWILALFSGALAAISGVQIFYLVRADNRAAAAANLAREQYVSDQRAYVFLHLLDLQSSSGLEQSGRHLRALRIIPQWRNSGKTPTRDMTVAFAWQLHPNELPPAFPYKFPQEPVQFFIGPGADEPQAPMIVGADEANCAYRDHIFPPLPPNPVHKLFIWGRAEYRDVFDNTKRHFSECCYLAVFSEEPQGIDVRFVQWGLHNRAGDV